MKPFSLHVVGDACFTYPAQDMIPEVLISQDFCKTQRTSIKYNTTLHSIIDKLECAPWSRTGLWINLKWMFQMTVYFLCCFHSQTEKSCQTLNSSLETASLSTARWTNQRASWVFNSASYEFVKSQGYSARLQSYYTSTKSRTPLQFL